MRPLQRPKIDTLDVLSLCLKGIDDTAFRAQLETIRATLKDTESTYDDHARCQKLHLIPRLEAVGHIEGEKLKALYSHMSESNGSARSIYDKIRNAAPNKKCPLCGVGTVAVLDHHLPKSKYPDLSITPINLVPACHFCNDTKKARYPKSAEQQTLHPYYDAHLSGQWIYARLERGEPPVILFWVNPPAEWDPVDKKRVQRHYTVCGLGITFSSNANDELQPIKEGAERVFTRGGQAAVKAHLQAEANRYSSRPNSWQFATYQALANDEWFTAGGFYEIP